MPVYRPLPLNRVWVYLHCTVQYLHKHTTVSATTHVILTHKALFVNALYSANISLAYLLLPYLLLPLLQQSLYGQKVLQVSQISLAGINICKK